MGVQPIVLWPEPWLSQTSVPVMPEEFGTEALKGLVTDLIDTLRELGGLGISAPQLSVHKAVIVVWGQDGHPLALCNPILTPPTAIEHVQPTEGCLSLPGVVLQTTRLKEIEVVGCTPDGAQLAFHAEGVQAIALQHEYDHLCGRTIADGVGKMKAKLLKSKMNKAMRKMERNVKAQREQYQELHSVRKELRAKAPPVEHVSSDYAIPEAPKPAEAPESDHVVANP